MRLIRLLFSLMLLSFSSTVMAAPPLTDDDIPTPLKPWVNWVLEDQDQRDCPFLYNDKSSNCVWPSTLTLNLNDQQGQFTQTWQVYKESIVRLPGSKKTWPQSVLVNEEPATVLQHNGFPAVKLAVGTQRVQGTFLWSKIPKALSITPETGIVNVTLNGKAVQMPEINQQGRLWLNSRQKQAGERDSLDIQVYRKIIDAHPMQVVTRIDLRVSGRQRDIELNQSLLEGFTALRLDSKLPARLDHNGTMRVQLRSGQWSITLTGRSQQPLTTLAMPKPVAKTQWPSEEIWVFEAHNQLRLVQVQGVNSISPRQTNLPTKWQALPAYRMSAKQTMQLKVLRRGNPSPEPDKLSLKRDLWLDFDGNAYTFRDAIRGSMTQGWRLEALPALQLGRVLIDANPQFITQRQSSELKGVEVRRGELNLQADSRYQADRSKLPVSGWDHDFTHVNATLHLPPGWRLFSAWGMDNTPNTWLQQWTLLDLFLVLITAVAVARLWQWQWGVLALITLALVWHEANAPRFIWLNLIAAVTLLRVLPDGLFKTLIRSYRNLSFLVLLLIIMPFMVNEVRMGLYPQLEKPWFSSENSYTADNNNDQILMKAEAPMEQIQQMNRAPTPMRQMMPKIASGSSLTSDNIYAKKRANKSYRKQQKVLKEIDPKANIQTGPGLPNWQWNQVNITWSGPVEKDETLDLVLISPAINLLLKMLGILLLIPLTWRLLSKNSLSFVELIKTLKKPKKLKKGGKGNKGKTSNVNLIATGLLLPLLFMPSHESNAETIPSTEILQQLKTRLLAPNECLPQCAQIERLSLHMDEKALQGRLQVHAAAHTIIPLPGSRKTWSPEQVLVDGEAATSLSRNAEGELLLGISQGIHTVTFMGKLPHSAQVPLLLPLKPHYVEWQSEYWNVDGIQDNGVPSVQLQLNRVLNKQSTTNADNDMLSQGNGLLPAFVSVKRTLHLGLDWTVDTTVQRLSPSGQPIAMNIPLLTGESVLTENLRVKNNALRINMNANQTTLHWQSRLPIQKSFSLQASDQLGFIETWEVETSPMWHIEMKGIPVIHHQQNDGSWLPTWKPWMKESVQFTVSRPTGVEGQTLTVNNSKLSINVGKRSDDVKLAFSLRSSQGTQHTLHLPEHAQLQSVAIDGKKQPVQQRGNKVTLPVEPRQQQITLEWREPHNNKLLFQVSPVDLGVANVNSSIHLSLPKDRWVLWAEGPQLGPAVLIWGVLIVILLGSILLGRSELAPIKTWQWFLLGVGLSQTEPLLMLIVIAWLVLLAKKETFAPQLSRFAFNGLQVGLALLTVVALVVLFGSVAKGLLGQPEMQIVGNSSYGNSLHWFQDRNASVLAQPWVISVPLLVYRLLMLLWALWLAFTLLGWLRWGWERVSSDELWRAKAVESEEKSGAAAK